MAIKETELERLERIYEVLDRLHSEGMQHDPSTESALKDFKSLIDEFKIDLLYSQESILCDCEVPLKESVVYKCGFCSGYIEG